VSYNPQPVWAFEAGHIARTCEPGLNVVDEDNEIVEIPAGSLLLTGGMGVFVLMETGRIFRVDELDALVIEYDSELLSTQRER